MEQRVIDPEKRQKVQRISIRIILAMSVLILAYVIYALGTDRMNIRLFEIMLGIFVVVYTLLNDVVEPYKLGLFQDMTGKQRKGYLKILLSDIVGVGALLYWVMGLNTERSDASLLPLLIYFLAAQIKRRFRPEFEGVEEEPKEEEAPY